MTKCETRGVERIKERWNSHANTFDEWYKTFTGAVENFVDWELLKTHLPQNKNAKILDAAGGTGRVTLPLAKLGYSLTLCDLSPRMLDVARQKLRREGLLEKIEVLECDIRDLRFADESFDFVLCWDGFTEDTEGLAIKELARVTKAGGRISVFLNNKWATAINSFCENPASVLTLIKSSPSYFEDDEGKRRVVSMEEIGTLFDAIRIRVIDIYAVCGWLNVLRIPETVAKSRNWDEEFFQQTTEMVLKLSKEPSVRGMSRHLVLYGEKY